MNNDNLQDIFLREDHITKEDINTLVSYTDYGSMGMFNFVVDQLQALKARILRGDIIYYDDKKLDIKYLKNIIESNFSQYIIKEVFKDTILSNKVFFNIENSSEGLDLIYTGVSKNKLFKWIADIDNEYSLFQLIPTGVVYIKNIKTNQMIPFLSENNSCYTYSQTDGKIKEVKNN